MGSNQNKDGRDSSALNKAQSEIAMEKFVNFLVDKRNDLWKNDKQKTDLRALIKKQLIDEINLHFINLLTEEDTRRLNNLLDKGADNEKINQFFTTQIDNFEGELTLVLENFKQMILGKQKN